MVEPKGYKGSFFRPNLHIYCRKKGEGRTPDELLAVPGVGPAKLERYGDAFLQALREPNR